MTRSRPRLWVGVQGLTAISLDLSHPVDVYGDWIDACDKAAKEAQEHGQPEIQNDSYNNMGSRGAPPPRRQRDVPSEDEEDGDGDGEMDDFVENDEGDEEEAY